MRKQGRRLAALWSVIYVPVYLRAFVSKRLLKSEVWDGTSPDLRRRWSPFFTYNRCQTCKRYLLSFPLNCGMTCFSYCKRSLWRPTSTHTHPHICVVSYLCLLFDVSSADCQILYGDDLNFTMCGKKIHS